MKTFLLEVKGAIVGIEKDYTQGSIKKAIVLLSIPMVLEMAMESIFAIVDIYFVSSLGASAVAVVGITESMMTLAYALGIGLSMATTAVVARRIGEKKFTDASNASIHAIIIALVMGLPMFFTGMFFTEPILRLMNASEETIAMGAGYTKIMMMGNVIIMLLFVINAVFRSAGDAVIAMRVLFLANGINIVLDPCLILGLGPFPEMGVYGAAVATNIGRGIGVAYQLVILFRGTGKIKVVLHAFHYQWQTIKKIIKLSLGTIGQFIIATSSWIFLMQMVARFGDEVIAGYTIAIRVMMFTILPSWGMSNAASTLVGQNLGANQPERAEQSVWYTVKANVLFLFAVGLFFAFHPGWFIGFFTTDPLVIMHGQNSLRIISVGFIFYAMGMVLSQSFNGAGDTYTPTKVNFICFWIIELPLAYLLANYTLLQEKGIYMAIPIAETILGIVLVILFKRGRWKMVKV